jgi:hypothetical protein
MENRPNEAPKALPTKKELKNQLADKMQTALPELREMLGEKKFANRVKKAAKLLMEGLHKEDVAKKNEQHPKKTTGKETATKKPIAKGATAKKAAVKKAATKTAKAAPAKKAKAANKKSTGK